jgi:hypothetical protein
MTEVAEAGVPVEPSRPMRRTEMAAAEATTHVTATHTGTHVTATHTATHVGTPEATAPGAASCRECHPAHENEHQHRDEGDGRSVGDSCCLRFHCILRHLLDATLAPTA